VTCAVGPASRTLPASPTVEDPSFRKVALDELIESYVEQFSGSVGFRSPDDQQTSTSSRVEAVCISVAHAKAFTVGINRLGHHVYPNAGIPNAMGGHGEGPDIVSSNLPYYARWTH